MSDESTHVSDPWRGLRRPGGARIGLGRAGGSLPTHELLDFQLAHARARDAVQQPFAAEDLAARIEGLGWPAVVVESQAGDRRTYLERPDLGRRLTTSNGARLAALRTEPPADLAVVASDGLSALAAERQIVPLVEAWLPRLRARSWRLAPFVTARFGRVALADEIGCLLGARLAVILLGERPGLGSPDSLGAYLVFEPRRGRSDAERNCVSNIRPEGLTPDLAAARLDWLAGEALRRGLSGVTLKDASDAALAAGPEPPRLA